MSEKPYWEGKKYAFFQHKECEFFPCHPVKDAETFNCLFCYCPLYALGDKCVYAIVQDMPRFVPELNALSETAFNEAHMFFGMDIRNIPGFEFSPMYIFPILSAGLQLVETVLNSHMNKAVNNGKMVGGISNALMLGMTFYFAASFPIICSLYWIARSLVDITITFILQTYIKSKPLEFFAERTLVRKNKDRAKRGLEPLVA